MKKSILALIIASTLMLSGCEEQQKLKETVQLLEHANLQLKRELDKVQTELKGSQDELKTTKEQLDTTTTNLENTKQQLDTVTTDLESTREQFNVTQQNLTDSQTELNKIKSEIPSIFTKQTIIFAQNENFQRDNTNDENHPINQSSITYMLTFDETGYEWLDSLLYKLTLGEFKIEENQEKETNIKSLENSKDQLLTLWQYWYDKDYEEVKNFQTTENNYIKSINYLGQRKNVVTFGESTYSYKGGAHGMFENRYFNIDIQRKMLITLNDVFAEDKQEGLTNLLWDNYEDHYAVIDGENKLTFKDRKDFYISKEFYFTPYGVHFVYPTYELGPYAAGEIQLKLSWDNIQELITEEYNWAK